MEGKTVGLGLIGAGGTFGTFIESALRDVEGGELTAIADVNQQALARASEQLHIERAYTSWEQLVQDPTVDAVIVASPPFTQFEIAHGVLTQGKALFLEKPGSIELDDLRALVDFQRAHNRSAAVDYVMRWNSLLDSVRHVTRQGLLGQLRSVQFVNYAQDEVLPPTHWFWDRSKSGGIFIEHGVHFFDLYGDLAGAAPKEVASARSVRDNAAPGGRIDQVDCAVVHDNGVLCAYFHAFNRPKALERQQAILAFDRGFITVHGWIADGVDIDAWVGDQEAAALRQVAHIVQQSEQPFTSTLVGRDAKWQPSVMISLRLGLPYNRNESYRREVARGLSDLIARMRDPSHVQRATLTDALRSLAVACAATGTATIDQVREIYETYRPDGG